ncbi:DNA-3-methyladenine glycosylase [Aquisphaera insulae]|uniref:DNA-3-methyladenine glycosylase n=1 Tax=Aquisphaera insulae TaxID=2712864 RepID=UPI0013EDF5BF|nr:DNA-3-methyladenine glycosylase [Aquisphaera insulae]
MKPLPHSFYDRPAEDVAPDLLGKLLIRREGNGKPRRVGRIVEAEAYLGPHDLAAHSSKGRTARTEVMFGPPGHAYVYLIYGMYNCLNAVTGPGNHASAVLLRALEPVENIDVSASGPGRLCRALNIDRTLNGHDMRRGGLFIAEPDEPAPPFEIVAGPRVGVDYAGEWAARPLRFSIAGNRHVSRR